MQLALFRLRISQNILYYQTNTDKDMKISQINNNINTHLKTCRMSMPLSNTDDINDMLYRVIQKSLCIHTLRWRTWLVCITYCMILTTTVFQPVVPCYNRKFTIRNIFVFLQVYRDFRFTLYYNRFLAGKLYFWNSFRSVVLNHILQYEHWHFKACPCKFSRWITWP
jgi:hypothetical protein